MLEELHHGLAHRFTHVHISFGVATVVTTGTTSLGERMGVYGGDVPLELWILSGLAINRKHGIKDFSTAIGGSFFGLAKRGADKFSVGCIKIFAKRFDEMNEILFVATGKRGPATVPVPLRPEAAGDLVVLGAWLVVVAFR